MKFIISLFVFIFIVQGIYAQDINVDYPSEVSTDEEFSFSIELIDFPDGIYDVKVDVAGGGSRISEILDNGNWKSTYFYINEAINPGQEKEFTLRTSEYSGEASIEVKIRKSSSSNNPNTFGGYNIQILGNVPQNQEDSGNSQSNEQEGESNTENEGGNEESEKKIGDSSNNQIQEIQESSFSRENQELEVIKLDSKDIKTSDDTQSSEELDSESKNKIYMMYGFVVLCMFMGILFILGKNKKDKNEFE